MSISAALPVDPACRYWRWCMSGGFADLAHSCEAQNGGSEDVGGEVGVGVGVGYKWNEGWLAAIFRTG
eukprot:764543-Hanusia_phi.AAC.2